MDRPALKRLLAAVETRAVDCIVVYKVDRLSRSLTDFARIVEVLDQNGVSFVSITQQFNTTTSIGRLTLNILLSFAQFEREIISERTRDKMSAARRKGKWIGGQCRQLLNWGRSRLLRVPGRPSRSESVVVGPAFVLSTPGLSTRCSAGQRRLLSPTAPVWPAQRPHCQEPPSVVRFRAITAKAA